MFVAAIPKMPKRGATATFGLVCLGLLAAAIPVGGVIAVWAHQHGLRTDWDIKGPPCPAPTHRWEEIVLSRQPHSFRYGGADFAHPFGAADCVSVPEGWFISNKAFAVCQFTAPIMVSVTKDGRTTLFEPGPGRHATIRLRRGRVTCVVGGWNAA
jgi:hypothetical protein